MSRRSRQLLFLLAALAAGTADARTWTTNLGRTFEAELTGVRGDHAIFAFPNGRTFSTPLADLSPQDRSHIGSRARAATRPSPEVSSGAGVRAVAANFRHRWPDAVRHDQASSVRVVSEDPKEGVYIYESPHYRYLCDTRLTSEVLRNFSVMFETTHRFCKSLPLGLAGTGHGRHPILLFGNLENYFRAGGPPGSAGCYDPSRGLVMAPLASLGVRPGTAGVTLDRSGTNEVLIHELAHQLTPAAYYGAGARGWFSEGLAEYVATTPYSWGYFQSDPAGRAAKAYVTARGLNGKAGRALGTTIQAPPLRDFMQMPYAEFSGAAANRNYGVALLLVHHFFHTDGNRDAARITAYLEALQAGRPALDELLAGRSFGQLEAEIAAAWLTKGVTLRFGG